MAGPGEPFHPDEDYNHISRVHRACFPPGVWVNVSDDIPDEERINKRLQEFREWLFAGNNAVVTSYGRVPIIPPTDTFEFIGLDVTKLFKFVVRTENMVADHPTVPRSNNPSFVSQIKDIFCSSGPYKQAWEFGARYVTFEFEGRVYYFNLKKPNN